MEQLGGMIGLNKREIITMAIHDFLKRLAASLMNLMLCQRSNKWPCSRLTVWSRTSTQPASTDRETGEVRPESPACADPLRKHHGERREEARNGHAEGAHRGVQKLVGQKVRIPVGAFVNKGAIMFYALRNEAQPISAS